MSRPELSISVVIPTCRGVEALAGTLQALARQTMSPEALEVVVVLDGHDAGRATALRDQRFPFRLVVAKSTGRGRAAACNVGVRAAAAEVVLLLDDDMLPRPDALAAHLSRHDVPHPVGIVGAAPVGPVPGPTLVARYVGRRFHRHLKKLEAAGRVTDVRDVYTGSFSIRRGVFLAVGGFDERFVEYGNEDGEFAGRLIDAGIPIKYAAEACAEQRYTKTFAQLAADNRAKGRTAQQFLSRHPERADESAVVRRLQAAPSRPRRVMRGLVKRLVAEPAGTRVAVHVTERVASAVETTRPASADRIVGLLLDACFWSGVDDERVRPTSAAERTTVVHYLDSTRVGGVEEVCLTLLRLLDRQRWRPVLLLHEAPGLASMIDTARRHGVHVEVVPPRRGPNGMGSVAVLSRRLRTLRPGVVHVHRSWSMAGNAGVVAATLARCPVVVTTEHLFLGGLGGRALRLRRLVDRLVHRHVAVSESLGYVLRDRFSIRDSDVEVIHNGVLPPTEPAERVVTELRRQWRSLAPATVLVPARLDEHKGHRDLLAALRDLPGVAAVLAGDGPDREALERLATTLGTADRVRFLGHRGDVPALMRAADVVVLPSLVEGLPLVLLEAAALGCPVVASDVDGVGEAVEPHVSGSLTPPGHPAALASAIRSVLDDPVGAARMGEAARDRFQADFRADVMAERYQRLYEQLLHRGRRIAPVVEKESTSLRKLDWRFLTGRECFGRAALFSSRAATDEVLGDLWSVAGDVVMGEEVEPATADLAVAVDPTTATLHQMVSVVRDGGSLVFASRGSRAGLLARTRDAGLGDAEVYLPWPVTARPRAWLPVGDDVAGGRVAGRPPPRRLSLRWVRSWSRWWASVLRLRLVQEMPVGRLFVVASKPGAGAADPSAIPLRQLWRATPGLPAVDGVSLTLLTGGRESISKAVALVTVPGALAPGLVVKWPRTVAAGEGLSREADNLNLLGMMHEGEPLRVPALLHAHATRVGPALVETLLEGDTVGRALTRASYRSVALTAADWLADLAQRTPPPEWRTREAWWHSAVAPVADSFAGLAGGSVDPRLLATMRRSLSALGPVPACTEHRDFAPWNVLVGADGHWRVTDWESSVAAGLPLTDLWYFLTWVTLAAERVHERRLAEVYARLTAPGTRTGEVCAEAVERYAAAIGLDRAAIPSLRALTWMIHAPSEVRRIERATGAPLQPDAFRKATFTRLWAHEVRRSRGGR